MRQIVNISLPSLMAKNVRREVKDGGYASVSEFFRELLREREENRILEDINQSRKEIAEGKGKVLSSLADLD